MPSAARHESETTAETLNHIVERCVSEADSITEAAANILEAVRPRSRALRATGRAV